MLFKFTFVRSLVIHNVIYHMEIIIVNYKNDRDLYKINMELFMNDFDTCVSKGCDSVLGIWIYGSIVITVCVH